MGRMAAAPGRREWREGEPLFLPSEWDVEEHPCLASVSCGMLGMRCVPVLKRALPTEFVEIRVTAQLYEDEAVIAAQHWNFTWQSGGAQGNWRGGPLGYEDRKNWPEPIRSILERCDEKVGIRFVPIADRPSIALARHLPLYQLLPLALLRKNKLPPLGRSTWPSPFFGNYDLELGGSTAVLRSRLERAVAELVWPLLIRQSGLTAFTKDDPIRMLAFNLDFWLPYLDQVVERRMRAFGRARFRKPADRRLATRLQTQLGDEWNVEPPLYHSEAWRGEEEACPLCQ